MVFQQPLFLYGLVLTAVPVLIHFLNFRRSRTLYFSSLRFIDEVNSTSRRRNRLTDLLLLLLRILAIAFLVLAFARPVSSPDMKESARKSGLIGIFIDNSLSMQYSVQGQSLLDKAKEQAVALVREFPPDSRFQVGFHGTVRDIPGLTDKEMTAGMISNIRPSEVEYSLEEVLSLYDQVAKDLNSRWDALIILSDFQATLFEDPIGRHPLVSGIIPMAVRPSSPSNISIDSCWLEEPVTLAGRSNRIMVSLQNRSETDYPELPVRLILNDSLRNEVTVSLAAGTSVTAGLDFQVRTGGWHTGSVNLSDFPIIFDNQLYFSFRIESGISVLHLYDIQENPFIRNAFGNDPYFRYESFTGKGFPKSGFDGYGLVVLAGIRKPDPVLEQRLRTYLDQGGTVWLFPDLNGDLAAFNSLLGSFNLPQFQYILKQTADSRIGTGQEEWLREVVVNVDKRLRMPVVTEFLRIVSPDPTRTDLISNLNGDILLSSFRAGRGSFVLTAFPLLESATDLMYHPLFIPLCYRLAAMRQQVQPLYVRNGDDQPYRLMNLAAGRTEPVRLTNSRTGEVTIPGQRSTTGSGTILFPGILGGSGFYLALQGTDTAGMLAVNTPRKESDLTYLSDSLVKEKAEAGEIQIIKNNYSYLGYNYKQISDAATSRKLWIYFLLAALLALLAESFVMYKKK